jgi:hypothetical protein
MSASPATPVGMQLELARRRLAECEARAARLAALIPRIGEGAQARALAESYAISEELAAHQRAAIATLEAAERDGGANRLGAPAPRPEASSRPATRPKP